MLEWFCYKRQDCAEDVKNVSLSMIHMVNKVFGYLLSQFLQRTKLLLAAYKVLQPKAKPLPIQIARKPC